MDGGLTLSLLWGGLSESSSGPWDSILPCAASGPPGNSSLDVETPLPSMSGFGASDLPAELVLSSV